MQILRYLLAAVSVLFVVGVAVQVFLAGMFLFADGDRATHVDFGYTIALLPLIALVLAAVARAGRRIIAMTAALFVVTEIQTLLPVFAEDAPFVAALHPVNALLVFMLAIAVARRSIALVRPETSSSAPPVAQTTAAAAREAPAADPSS